MPTPTERATAADRQRRLDRRQRVEAVLDLAQHLPDADRLLLEQLYRHGVPLRDLSRLTGKPRGVLARRIRRLVKALLSDEGRRCLARQDLLPPPVRRVALCVFVRGRSLRQAANETGLTLHRVRQHLATARRTLGH